MAEIKVRGLDQTVVDRITELAEKKGKKREAYLRDILTTLSYSGELMELDFKYASLVETLSDQAAMLSDIIERNTYVINMAMEKMEDEE